MKQAKKETREYKIGNLKLENPFFLAPMLEPNDIAFRTLCKKAGAGLTYTGMINPLSQQKIVLDDKPAIQIFCTKEEGVKEFMKKYDPYVSLWDFNLGCPSKLAKKLGFGSFMHNELEQIENILKIMRENTKKPLTIKIRKSKQTEKIIKIAKKYCDAICIHPRTSEQGYSGIPDIEFALKIKKKLKIPVIYSGNVNEKNAKDLLNKFDFVMIGREAMGNPQVFSKLTNRIGVKEPWCFKDYLTLAEKYHLYFRQIKMQAMCFTKSMYDAKEKRNAISKAKTLQEIKKIFNV